MSSNESVSKGPVGAHEPSHANLGVDPESASVEGDTTIRRETETKKCLKTSHFVSSEQQALGEEEDYWGLTPQQASVLGLLLMGIPTTKAARMTGVGRATVYRWMKQDEFQAMLNRGRRERMTAVETQIDALTPLAVNAVAQSLSGGNERLGLQMLKGLGFLKGEPAVIGSSDPAEVAAARKNKDQYKEIIKELDRSVETAIRECIG